MDTTPRNGKIFDLISGNARKIESLLEEIETGYRENYIESIKNADLDKETLKNHLLVANQTFINYFVNGDLNYVEQEIDRINMAFKHSKNYILAETGLELEDFLFFYEMTDFVDFHKMEQFIEDTTNDELEHIINETYHKKIKPTSEQFEVLFNSVENALHKLPIAIELLYEMWDREKVDRLLAIFSIKREQNEELRYYTDECSLLAKPIIWLNEEFIILPVQKQLIHAIFNFLFETCKGATKNGHGILRQKDKIIEDKTYEIFNDFFDGKAKIFRNYYVGGEEKDLLVLYRGVAFVLECKAYEYREPLREPSRAFERIRDDFKKGIQKGYEQAWGVRKYFTEGVPLELRDKNGHLLETIQTKRYRSCFSIVVTSERYGQIQCDLGLLLKLEENDIYPWAVYIDDLETFLLTLKRKNNFFGDFTIWLTLRELLHERLICFDELELCTYFLMKPKEFSTICKRIEDLYFSSPDMHLLFDNLYQTGLGFKDERHLDRKAKKKCQLSAGLKLKTPTNIRNYRKQQNLDKRD